MAKIQDFFGDGPYSPTRKPDPKPEPKSFTDKLKYERSLNAEPWEIASAQADLAQRERERKLERIKVEKEMLEASLDEFYRP